MEIKEAFAGTWSLLEYLLVRADGVVRKPWGEHVSGLLIYTRDGYMSANLMPAVRRKASHAVMTIGTNDKSHRSSRYISYAGRYTVDVNTIVHHVEVSLFPTWVGLPQVRHYELGPERLVLKTPPIQRLGKHMVGQLTWKRVS